MKNPRLVPFPLVPVLTALFLTSALSFAASSVSAAPASGQLELHAAADKAAKKLPITSSFNKVKEGENKGLYVLTLKNDSSSALKVTATVHESVISHNRPKTRVLPQQTIEAGKTWQIEALAAHDKVTLVAEGFETLELVTP
jgi:hypothetical protein